MVGEQVEGSVGCGKDEQQGAGELVGEECRCAVRRANSPCCEGKTMLVQSVQDRPA